MDVLKWQYLNSHSVIRGKLTDYQTVISDNGDCSAKLWVFEVIETFKGEQRDKFITWGGGSYRRAQLGDEILLYITKPTNDSSTDICLNGVLKNYPQTLGFHSISKDTENGITLVTVDESFRDRSSDDELVFILKLESILVWFKEWDNS
ncbi:hypothetical protein MHM98_02180 [Psychrobium sp. MM17-31]|uniref:hypothetical protein n=1 Tax=Psychrobium sp. MM17-31 TaxID=2917758 RepID=UPI001EF3F0EC|nr:hypothetical protein [Psychrobium sp. MM17-31]MCG7530173.1 hypothetical protein [Psychrobium sp. MM17-31]